MLKQTRNVCFLLVLLLLIACASPAPRALTTITPAPVPSPATGDGRLTSGRSVLTILHTNDMHGNLEGEKLTGGDSVTFEFGGIANAMGTIAKLTHDAGANTIVVDDGDFWQGTYASNRDEGRSIIEWMNLVGYDALTLGNHDFDHGLDVLKARAAEARFPFLAANILDVSTGKPPAWLKPFIVKEIGGTRVGIIGLANSGTPVISKASNTQGLRFLNELDAARQIIPQVKSQADLIVVAAHEGIDNDQRLAEQVPGIDVIISGHTHVEQRVPRLIGNTIIVHAGYKAQYVGRLELSIDTSTKKVLDHSKSNELIAVVSNKTVTPQPITDSKNKLLEDARDAINRPIGETRSDLLRQYTSDGRTTGEYALGNLVVDAMLAANQAGSRPADLAMYNQGVRADLKRGTITYGELYDVFPFDNVLVALDLTGAQIKSILEIATSCPRVNTLVAGLSFTYDCRNPQGHRVNDVLVQGQPLDLTKIYRVQTVDYLIGGGDGQTPFKEGTNIAYGDPVIDVVADYVSRHSPLDNIVEGRIIEGRK